MAGAVGSDARQTAPQELLATILTESLACLTPSRAWRRCGCGARPAIGRRSGSRRPIPSTSSRGSIIFACTRCNAPAFQPSDLRPLFDHLQETLGRRQALRFRPARVAYGYLRAEQPISTSSVPAYVVDQREPGEFLPTGEHTVMHRNILSEIEMSLHEHEVNVRRVEEGQAAGQFAVALGRRHGARENHAAAATVVCRRSAAGSATGRARQRLPTSGRAISRPVRMPRCTVLLRLHRRTTLRHEYLLEATFRNFASCLRSNRVSRLILLFRDGLRADVRRSHTLKFWRRDNELLD